MPDHPLDGETIRRYLQEVDSHLAVSPGPRFRVAVVGGSLLAMLGLRDTTADVDSVLPVEPELRAAAEHVASAHDLDPQWLNDRAKLFLPRGFEQDTCSVLLAGRRLTILAPPLDTIFLMKLYASRPQDQIDLAAIWDQTTFADAHEAAAAFESGYPHLEHDPHLASFIASTVARYEPPEPEREGTEPPESLV